MDLLKEKLAKLIDVKSIVSLIMVICFAVLALTGVIIFTLGILIGAALYKVGSER